jgi:hypothetical protein
MNSAELQSAVDRAAARGGGTVVVPAGIHRMTRLLVLRTGVTLQLERGARLLGSPRLADHVFEGKLCGMILARKARHVRIRGEGTIDGNYRHFFDFHAIHGLADFNRQAVRGGRGFAATSPDGPVKPKSRPGNMVVFSDCRDVAIEGITLTGASYWTVHFADCRGISFRDVNVDNDPSVPNNDGVHMTDCRDAVVRGCRFRCGDDCVAISGWNRPAGEPEIHLGFTRRSGACEDITVQDCVMSSRSAAVRIWSVQSPVRRVRLSNLEIGESNRGIGIFLRGPREIRDVAISGVRVKTRYHSGTWWGNAEPLHISAMPGERIERGRIDRIRVRNFSSVGENGILIYSHVPGLIRDVSLEGVSLRIRKGRWSRAKAGYLDLRPTLPELGLMPRTGTGLTAVNADSLRIRGLRVRYDSPMPPHMRPGPQFENVRALEVAGLRETSRT